MDPGPDLDPQIAYPLHDVQRAANRTGGSVEVA
jgi:hypothetical protein